MIRRRRIPVHEIPAQINDQWLEERNYLIEDIWTIRARVGEWRCRLVCWIALEASRRWHVNLSVNNEVSGFPVCTTRNRDRALIVAKAIRQAVITIKQENAAADAEPSSQRGGAR